MSNKSSGSWTVVTVVLLSACGGGSPPGGTGGAGGGPPDAGTPADAAAETGGPSDAGDAGTNDIPRCRPFAEVPDATFPSTAPCVWALLAPCLPILNQCIRERVDSTELLCAPGSSWSRTSLNPGFPPATSTVSKDGRLCYRSETTWSSGGPFTTYYYDGTGKFIAVENDSPNSLRLIHCADDAPETSYTFLATCARPNFDRCTSITDGDCP
jgi:hypothetical protein